MAGDVVVDTKWRRDAVKRAKNTFGKVIDMHEMMAFDRFSAADATRLDEACEAMLRVVRTLPKRGVM